MDNALIDDRRIHVDFSQSVAKLWSQYRRKDHQKGKGKFTARVDILLAMVYGYILISCCLHFLAWQACLSNYPAHPQCFGADDVVCYIE